MGKVPGVVKTWRPPGPLALLAYGLEGARDGPFLQVLYLLGPDPAARVHIEQLTLIATRPHFGGRRWWLRCPRPGCGKRVRIVYLQRARSGLGCRGCHGLTYYSRQHHRESLYEGAVRPGLALSRCYRDLHRRHDWLRRRLPAILHRQREAWAVFEAYLGSEREDLRRLVAGMERRRVARAGRRVWAR